MLSRFQVLSRFSGRATCLAPSVSACRTFSDGPSAQAISNIQETFRSHPDKALATFSAKSTLRNGLFCDGSIRDKFTISADEPTVFGGSDKAPNPIEILLFSLASCQEITYKAYANALGIPLKSVSVDLSGDIDFRGFFAVSEDVRPGFQQIEGTVTIDSPAGLQELEQLKEVVDSHCPVEDMLQVPISLELQLHEKK